MCVLWLWLCTAGLETDPSKRKDAVEAYQRALAFDPGNKRAHHGLGATKAHHPIHSEAFPFGCRDTGLPLSGFVALLSSWLWFWRAQRRWSG